MAISFEIEAKIRQDVGKGASRRLRRQGQVPAIVYGAGQEVVYLVLDHAKTHRALSHEAFYSHILNLKIGSESEKVILKDVQRHPFKLQVQHIDFLRVRADQILHMSVPLHFLGETTAPGVKQGGIVSRLMTDLEVACLPADLPEYIEVDISSLNLNETIHLSQIKLPKGVNIVALTQNDLPVISIHMPRAVVEETGAPVAPTEVPATQVSAAPPAASETKKEK